MVGKHLRFIFLAFSSLAIPVSNSQTIQIQGEQSGTLLADTVILSGNVTVPENSNLTFLPGTKVISSGFFGFNVLGSIHADGTDDFPVSFSVADTAGFSNPENERGGWDGFDFTATSPDSDSSVFSYCIFQFGKAFGDSLEKMGGVFNIRGFDFIKISDCRFENNRAYYWGGAVFCESGDILISGCTFENNSCGTPGPPYGYGGAVCTRYSNASIVHNTFTGNASTGIGGAVSFEYSDILLNANYFHENFSGLGGALGYLRSDPVRNITNNLFTGNSCVFFGGAISCNRAHPHFVNNTITENFSQSYGGGFYCNDSAVPVLVNNILYNNFAPVGSEVYIWDIYSAPEFYYCNVEGGYEAFEGSGGTAYSAPYINNIDTIPGFSFSTLYPYSLSENSPCINTGNPDTTALLLPGTDLAGVQRIYDGIIDMGAYEFQPGVSANQLQAGEEVLYCYPNPFSDRITISKIPANFRNSTLEVTDINGKTIIRRTGIHGCEYTWVLSPEEKKLMKPGLFFIKLNSGNKKGIGKLIYMPD
ncbi:MAG: T9SS type A sorting domain-containing protein [Bacteroidales bacterium]|nr:T9SS type A sorting domain-containing protein [Bacteroidales bacterium]